MNRRSILTTLRTYSQRLRAAAFALLCTALMAGGAMAQTVTYFHNDIAGTPQLATNASGAVVWKENYLPYGQRQVAEPASAGNRLWYTGKPHDVDTGLTYMGARYYMPTLGRFTGIDPKEFSPEQPHSLNRYAYGNNNPYKYVDPDGRSPVLLIPLIWAVGGAATSGAVNAIAQQLAVGQVQWSGVGGVMDAASDGLLLGPVFGVAAARGAVTAAKTAATVEKDFFAGTKYTDKVLGQMKQGDFHAFPESVKGFQDAGQLSKLTGGDGVVRDMLKIPGEYKGKQGVFEFIKESDGSINHRLFRPDAGQ